MTSTDQPFNSSTSSDVVIRVENLYKEYRLGTISHGTLYRDLQSWWARMRGKEDPNSIISTIQPSTINHSTDSPHLLALKDVSFEVKRGEVLGIIGRNGAGKSTLLKILSEVTSPTKGTVKIKGRVASLLEVGTGFHPELTGRENIYLNGAILGMTKGEINRKFEEIVDFAEVEKFMDTPVKRFSSGMYVRLAFAVAAHLEPEILIIDEVLAVGDAQFQKKCLGKLGDVAKGGRTVLFVSHNMGAVKSLCSKAIIINAGQLIYSGDVEDGLKVYIGGNEKGSGKFKVIEQRKKDALLSITKFWLQDRHGEPIESVFTGDYSELVFEFKAALQFNNLSFAIAVFDLFGSRMTRLSTADQNTTFIKAGSGRVRCILKKLPFAAGRYSITIGAYELNEPIEILRNEISFDVQDADYYGTGVAQKDARLGPVLIEHDWRLE